MSPEGLETLDGDYSSARGADTEDVSEVSFFRTRLFFVTFYIRDCYELVSLTFSHMMRVCISLYSTFL